MQSAKIQVFQVSRVRGLLTAGFLSLAILPSVAAAQLQGDCNNNGTVSIGEVVTCANIFLGITPIVQCAECDQNANGTVTIGEVVGAANCFSNSASESCRTVVSVATPTPTAVPSTPTNTAVPNTPTNTAVPNTPTNTPVPNTPTNTAVPPTPTATETATPIPPTDTPTPEPTATPTENAGEDFVRLKVLLQPPGGSNGNCRGTCVAGSNAGNDCGVNADCPGSSCGGTKSCVGGALHGQSCSQAAQCTECRGNFQGAVVAGSCATVQGTALKVIIPPNGVCAPRLGPPDISCATNAECPEGRTCELPGFEMEIDKVADENGIRGIRVDGDTFALPPAFITVNGNWACITAAGEGVGFIDCDGGTAGVNVTINRDHNTTPGSPGNSGSAVSGFADDANCDTPLTTPLGSLVYPCLEGSKTCRGGEHDQLRCNSVDDCPGGEGCLPCAAQDPPPLGHSDVCNSPNRASVAATFAAGDIVIVLPLAITQLNPSAGQLGPDGLPCTADDLPSAPPAAVPVTLSTGLSTINVYDANNNALTQIRPTRNCPFAPCVTRIRGTSGSCAALDENSSLAGVAFGGGFPALDVAIIGDIVTTFKFEVLSSEVIE